MDNEKDYKIITEEEFASELDLKILFNPHTGIKVTPEGATRPGLALSGFDKFFSSERVQVIGKSEMNYLSSMGVKGLEALKIIFTKKIPCLIVTRKISVNEGMIKLAEEYDIPVFQSTESTSEFIVRLSTYINDCLAKTMSIHGVLLDLFGTGVLLTGKSGIGKSETALELIHRGHRLISDDIVDIRVSKNGIYGSSPDITKHFMELRGVGIIDVKAIFGVGSVSEKKKIELVIELEKWDDNKSYERLGLHALKTEILGEELTKIIIPVMPGRNLAIVIEVATRDFRLKQNGYNSAQEIKNRMET